MDFFKILTREGRKGITEVYPDFIVGRSKDLMVRGKSFYAIWDEADGMWSTDEYSVQRLVDDELRTYAEEHGFDNVKYMASFSTNGWNQFRKFMSQISDNSHQLDTSLTFSNTETKKTDYVSRRLPYPLEAGDHSAWDEVVGTLYSPEQREKIEWAIGAVVAGDSKKIQKFLVFYGDPGTGKGTILDIIIKMFPGYVTTFEAKSLVGGNNQFALEMFRQNPLVAIQHDGDLSRIEDNTKLNSIASHELMTMNEKHKASYSFRVNAFLFMGTNKPVKITDAKSGLIRRLIDVHPTGVLIPTNHYHTLLSRIEFEFGAIAQHCLDVYRKLGKNYYNNYRPLEMMLQTDIFFNFVEGHYDIFKKQDGCSLKQAWELYKIFCAETGIDKPLPQYRMRTELQNYFEAFHERLEVDGVNVRSYYTGFKLRPGKKQIVDTTPAYSLVLDESTSIFDEMYANQPAQYAKEDGTPTKYWTDEPRLIDGVLTTPKPSQVVDTVLSDLDTSKPHYVKLPPNHIVIDFDLKDEDGRRDLESNLRAASSWPGTYAELSRSTKGVHLHYIYSGAESSDVLNKMYSEGIEVKSFGGNSSLRRAYSRSNRIPVATISSGLPLKEKKVLDSAVIKTEKGLRDLIARNLRKEIHPGTKPSIDFIAHILKEAYESGVQYDVTDLKPRLAAFANNSTNQSLICLKTVMNMKLKSVEIIKASIVMPTDDRMVFFDVEVFPNLFVVCWSYEDSDEVVRMINPTPAECEVLSRFKLVGFYNRRYDNHILWARILGYTNEQLYLLSQKIMGNVPNSMFGEAYELSWADIWEFSSKRQSLKKFQIELGLKHVELDIPWDKPVPEERWVEVADYCANDVVTSKGVFKARKQDYVARQILAELSGLSINETTQRHAARFIFGTDKRPQSDFVYTDLSKEFPGYVFEKGKSTYRGETVGEGGYVYAEPGMYQSVALLDVASMHPTSIVHLDMFGPYTKVFGELMQARLAIKREDFDRARVLLGGRLGKFLDGDSDRAKGLSEALKIVINIVYGLTSAKFDNPFRDLRNRDNIAAKRGALFMIDLKLAVQAKGYTVAHIKTDSIKIPNADWEIIDFVKKFGDKYGYTFEHNPDKDIYDKFCLVNDAVYIARHDECMVPHWTAVGAQFQHPYVFKTLFSNEEITFEDLCEPKHVTQGSIYIDFDAVNKAMVDYNGMHFVGRTGIFVPVKEGFGGGILYRVKDGKCYAVAGSKGHLWTEASVAASLPPDAIDMTYFEKLAMDARNAIDHFGSFAEFVR